jgi:hypothetical protein
MYIYGKKMPDCAKPLVPGQMECSSMQLAIDPERIYFLKFILEGYDGLAIQSTIDAKSGIVEILYPPEMEKDLQLLLAELKPVISKSSSKN